MVTKVDIHKGIVTAPFKYAERNGYLRISIGTSGEMMGVGGGEAGFQPITFNSYLIAKIIKQNSKFNKANIKLN